MLIQLGKIELNLVNNFKIKNSTYLEDTIILLDIHRVKQKKLETRGFKQKHIMSKPSCDEGWL